jgi:hypothetical protein
MILGFKKQFANGTPTNFLQKIHGCVIHNGYKRKIHSLRKGNRWHAGHTIQMAYGVRTPHYQCFNASKKFSCIQHCINTQEVFMTYRSHLEITVDGRHLMPYEIDALIQNDGLTRDEFINWFFPGATHEWSGQIIHWTDFKY